jgi:hypothetical protein
MTSTESEVRKLFESLLERWSAGDTFHNTRVRPIARGLRAVMAWGLADAVWGIAAAQPTLADTGMSAGPSPNGSPS